MPCSIPAERLLMLSELLSSISAAIQTLYEFLMLYFTHSANATITRSLAN